VSKKSKLIQKTDAATEALKSSRVRWVTGRSQVKVDIDEKKYRKVIDSIINDEIERHLITGVLKNQGSLTIEEISELTDLLPSTILQHIIALRMKGEVGEAGEKNSQYLYKFLL